MLYNQKSRILILSSHTDDFEIAMGASAAKLVDEGHDIFLVTFCNAWESLPTGFDKDTLINEQLMAAEAIGLKKQNIYFKDYPVRRFPEFRQEILDDLILLKKQIQPNIIFGPSKGDIHQDHTTLAHEMIRAFKDKTIFSYVLPWNMISEKNQVYVEVDQKHLDKKSKAIACYESQSKRSYMAPDKINALTIANGIDVNLRASEKFEAVRIIFRSEGR